MRRKTKAQRILDYENEEDEEEEQKPDSFSNGSQKRRKMYPSKEKEENSSSDAGLQKLDIKVNELDCSSADLYTDSPPESEEAHYLQSYSKKELIAMVLCMQREMEDLKEQLRCLTACGKLARNLETLIEKTQMWSNGNNGTSLGTPVSQGTVQEPAKVDVVIPDVLSPPAVVNGQWLNQGPGPQKPHETTQNAQSDGLFTEFITPDLLERCNTGITAQKLTNDLLRGLYDRDCLASHSISGVIYNKKGQPKPALPTEEIQAILRTVQYFFPIKTDAEIKGYIRQKLQNEAKRLRKKPSFPAQYESRGLNLPSPKSHLDMIDQN